MKEKREMSVRELINNFVTICYFQEVRIFRFGDIYGYIYDCYKHSSVEYCENTDIMDLIDEAQEAIEDMLNDGTLSYVYPDGAWGMYRVNDKKDFIEIARYPKDYIREMNKVFLDILGGDPQELTLTLSNKKKNNR